MSEIRIADAQLVASLKNSDKLPISSGDGQAHSVSMELLKNFCGGLTRVSWNDITGKPTFSDVALSGEYSQLLNKPTIPSKTSELTNNSGFTTADEVNKTIETKGFITKKEVNTTYVALPKITEIEATPITQIEVQSNSTYLIDCSSGVVEKIEIMNFAPDLNTVKIFVKMVSKPIQLVFPKNAIFLMQMPPSVDNINGCVIEMNLNYVKYYNAGNPIM